MIAFDLFGEVAELGFEIVGASFFTGESAAVNSSSNSAISNFSFRSLISRSGWNCFQSVLGMAIGGNLVQFSCFILVFGTILGLGGRKAPEGTNGAPDADGGGGAPSAPGGGGGGGPPIPGGGGGGGGPPIPGGGGGGGGVPLWMPGPSIGGGGGCCISSLIYNPNEGGGGGGGGTLDGTTDTSGPAIMPSASGAGAEGNISDAVALPDASCSFDCGDMWIESAEDRDGD